MILLRLLAWAVTGLMTVITLVIGVSVLLGVAWMAVAVPVLVLVGIFAAVRLLWRRLAGEADADRE